ncbi:acetyl-CoA carboxylase biotin carboxyl carrier protein [Candidatus Magnetaquicoccus inordinatus]|uniref:acetyl-CoA carboxylase biotin carboxyl carrier protein n=1 Tax=Candidatus Magnetaquicoccus inordinatus TaxID=2496818 RepID=UPI00102CB90A|nr:acetyl-CoA carboxylase biotin carboxyl carrier protein [Candidatus Magnetaquicoccus inordinatus]
MDLKEIRQLIKMLAGTDVAEIEIREEAQTVRISRHLASQHDTAPPAFSPMVTYAAPQPVAMSAPVAVAVDTQAMPPVGKSTESMASDKTLTITSPMVGTYYQSNSPEAPPLVAHGDIIKKGQVVCIIEAMKLMNAIEAEHSGRVVSILKENASPVEYGEPLFILEPV